MVAAVVEALWAVVLLSALAAWVVLGTDSARVRDIVAVMATVVDVMATVVVATMTTNGVRLLQAEDSAAVVDLVATGAMTVDIARMECEEAAHQSVATGKVGSTQIDYRIDSKVESIFLFRF